MYHEAYACNCDYRSPVSTGFIVHETPMHNRQTHIQQKCACNRCNLRASCMRWCVLSAIRGARTILGYSPRRQSKHVPLAHGLTIVSKHFFAHCMCQSAKQVGHKKTNFRNCNNLRKACGWRKRGGGKGGYKRTTETRAQKAD